MEIKAKTPFVKREFALRLKTLRRLTHSTQEGIADAIGVSRRTYNQWENPNNTAHPTDIEKLVTLCELLDTTPTYLLTGAFEEKREKSHKDRYLGLYDRYRNNADFHFLVRMLMELDDEYMRIFSEFGELLYEKITRTTQH